jgi:hypothetical protein
MRSLGLDLMHKDAVHIRSHILSSVSLFYASSEIMIYRVE